MRSPPITDQAIAIVKAAVDERFGENTSEMIKAYQSGEATQQDLATRFGLTQQAICQRVRKARTYTRRLLRAAGVTTPEDANEQATV